MAARPGRAVAIAAPLGRTEEAALDAPAAALEAPDAARLVPDATAPDALDAPDAALEEERVVAMVCPLELVVRTPTPGRTVATEVALWTIVLVAKTEELTERRMVEEATPRSVEVERA